MRSLSGIGAPIAAKALESYCVSLRSINCFVSFHLYYQKLSFSCIFCRRWLWCKSTFKRRPKCMRSCTLDMTKCWFRNGECDHHMNVCIIDDQDWVVWVWDQMQMQQPVVVLSVEEGMDHNLPVDIIGCREIKRNLSRLWVFFSSAVNTAMRAMNDNCWRTYETWESRCCLGCCSKPQLFFG